VSLASWLLKSTLTPRTSRRKETSNMFRLLAASATLALITTIAFADDNNPRAAGTKGTITAWDETTTKVLEHRYCVKSRYTWDYVSCGNRLRDALKRHHCRANGPGRYTYFTQIGDGKPYQSTLVCR
jgi:hypothetical protein